MLITKECTEEFLFKETTLMFNIENRRYIGNKTKLLEWIFSLIREYTENVYSFCDIFAGTGSVSNRAIQVYDHVITNDFLYSNKVIYDAFFGMGLWNQEKIEYYRKKYNSLDVSSIGENYFSENYGNKFFDYESAKLIGYIRDDIEDHSNDLNSKEKSILLASLIYSMDRIANTLGHYDAYIKKTITRKGFHFDLINSHSYNNVDIYRADANQLAKELHADLVYIDPPYNSRQYSRFYHVYENLIEWTKPKLYGTAMKPKPENMSEYCRSDALQVFTDLIESLDTNYIVVSYNNTYNSKSKSSKNRIELSDLKEVLTNRGETLVFDHDYNAFQAGKTDLKEHKEYLFITKI